jgi:hypothetical protein
MSTYTILNPEGINDLPMGTTVDLTPEEVNEWIAQGAKLQCHQEAEPEPVGGLTMTSEDLRLL